MLLIFWLGIKIYLSMSLSLLPQIWVKPLTTNAQVAYTVWDVTEAGYARVGEDIVYNTWNLLLLDLHSTVGRNTERRKRLQGRSWWMVKGNTELKQH